MRTTKTYFASDFHLGLDARQSTREREKQIVRWLSHISKDADALYLLGDVFDHWFEYSAVVPKGFTRIFGKLAELTDGGLPVYFFTGNHDMWMFRYLEDELNIPIIRKPLTLEIKGKTFFIGHGDGLGPGDHGYKIIKKVFASRICQWGFARIHPNFGIRIMKYFSIKSRDNNQESKAFLGAENEWLIQYCEQKIKGDQIDYFVFGHRHLPIEHVLSNGQSRYFNLGDWMTHYTFLEWDGQEARLKKFE